jgi:hypothetical protein
MEMGCGSGRVVAPLTVKAARASNPRGTAAMWIRDRLDELFVDEDFAAWYPSDGRPGLSCRPGPAQPGSRWCRCCNIGLSEYLSPGITPHLALAPGATSQPFSGTYPPKDHQQHHFREVPVRQALATADARVGSPVRLSGSRPDVTRAGDAQWG